MLRVEGIGGHRFVWVAVPGVRVLLVNGFPVSRPSPNRRIRSD